MEGRDRDTSLYRQKWEYPCWEVEAERPAKDAGRAFALMSEGHRLGNRSGWVGPREESRRSFESGGGLDWRAVFGSSPQPSGLHELQAAFTAARPAANWVIGANGIARCLG